MERKENAKRVFDWNFLNSYTKTTPRAPCNDGTYGMDPEHALCAQRRTAKRRAINQRRRRRRRSHERLRRARFVHCLVVELTDWDAPEQNARGFPSCRPTLCEIKRNATVHVRGTENTERKVNSLKQSARVAWHRRRYKRLKESRSPSQVDDYWVRTR